MPCYEVTACARVFKLLAVLAIAASGPLAPTAGWSQVLKLGTYINEADVRYPGLRYFADLTRERTAGRVTVQVFPSDSLMPLGKAHDAILAGLADIGAIAVVDKRTPCYRFLFVVPTPIAWKRHVEFDEKFLDLIRDEFGRVGLVPLFSSNFSYDQDWAFRKPVAKISDLNGLQVRSVGPAVTHAIRKWGGKPVFISPVETYQAAERGVVDGSSVGIPLYVTAGWYKIFPVLVRTSLWYGNAVYAINKQRFDALPAGDKSAVTSAARDMERWISPRYSAWIDEKLVEVSKQGVQIVNVTGEERKRLLATVQDGWMNQLEESCGPALSKKVTALFSEYQQ